MRRYLITDPEYYGSDPARFVSYLDTLFSRHSVDFAAFRDKSGNDLDLFAPLFLERARLYGVARTLLSGDVARASKYGFFGVHLRSDQFHLIPHARTLGLFTVVSTHTKEEAREAAASGADAITFSPIFPSPGKGAPQGVRSLEEVVEATPIPCFALGGILTEEQISMCAQAGAYGFASIRYFAPDASNFKSLNQ